MNAIISRLGGTTALTTYTDALSRVANAIPTIGGGLPILKLDKDSGDFIFGEDEVLVTEDMRFAVDVLSFKHGYLAFGKDGLAETEDGVAEVIKPVSEELPAFDKLPACEKYKQKGEWHTPKWQFQLSVEMAVYEAEDKDLIGTKVVYKPVSIGGLGLMQKLIEEINRRLRMKDNGGDVVPVIEMYSESYDHSRNGRIFNPLYELDAWVQYEGDAVTEADSFEDEEPVEKEAPKKRTRKKPAKTSAKEKAPIEEVEDDEKDSEQEEPPRRRRRRAETVEHIDSSEDDAEVEAVTKAGAKALAQDPLEDDEDQEPPRRRRRRRS